MGTSPEKSALADDLDFSANHDALRARGKADGLKKSGPLTDCSQKAAKVQRSALIKIIEGEIIPKLFMAHRELAPRRLAGIGDQGFKKFGDYELLADFFLRGNTEEIVDCLQSMITGGMRREHVYLEFLAPAPQALSLLWSEGRCSFDEMAKGLCCVDRVLHELHEREHSGTD